MIKVRAIRNIKAVFIKQITSYFRNPAMLGTPVAFLLIPFAILLLVPNAGDDAQRRLIVAQFVVMFVGISMIGTSTGFIMEDRQTMNLRFMGMAGVKPYQYLLSTCATLLIISFTSLLLFGLMGRYSGQELVTFYVITMLGAANSMLLGITLGLSKFAPFSPIVGVLLGVGPIFADANETLATIFSYTYTHQVNTFVRGEAYYPIAMQVVLINLAVLVVAFILMNSRYGLDGERLNV